MDLYTIYQEAKAGHPHLTYNAVCSLVDSESELDREVWADLNKFAFDFSAGLLDGPTFCWHIVTYLLEPNS